MQALSMGQTVLIFPEGTLSYDGRVGTFQSGCAILVRREKPLIVPMAIEGAMDAWPRSAKRPHAFGRVQVRFGEPMSAAEFLAQDASAVLTKLSGQVEALRAQARLDMGLPALVDAEQAQGGEEESAKGQDSANSTVEQA
jgi:1-acyl-sn-glycerol-3-phosphate acyltransferase